MDSMPGRERPALELILVYTQVSTETESYTLTVAYCE